jgi:hypothetical protein
VLVLAGSTSGCGNSSPRSSATGTFTLANGATFFTIGDLVLAKAPPTVTAIQDQAKVTLVRI